MSETTDHPELIAELSGKLNDILDHGDPEIRELIPNLIREFHGQVMSDPKVKVGIKERFKLLSKEKVIPLRTPERPPLVVTPKKKQPTPDYWQPVAMAIIVMAGLFVISSSLGIAGPPTVTCNIKGNIGKGGEKIYHMPGTHLHSITKLDTASGEDRKSVG